jgi:hypothetical protein
MLLSILNPGSSIAPSAFPYSGGQHINDYSSLIWTERFRDYGEFQLNIPFSNASANIFWPGQLLGIQESSHVMLAETQQEVVNDQGYRDVVVTGRSAESIIEDRVLWAPQGSTLTLARQYNDLDAALIYIWQAILNNTTSDVGYTVARPSNISVNGKLSDVMLTDSVYNGTTTGLQKILVNLGQIGPTVRNFLLASNLGLRCVKPPSNVVGIYSVTVDPVNGANKGAITKTLLAGNSLETRLRFDVYKGTDRSVTNPVSVALVYLSSEAGHLDNVNVATTYREFVTNTVHGIDSTHYYGSTTSVPMTADFRIRHRYIDASSLVSGMAVADYPAVIAKDQQRYFQEHCNRAVLTADLTINSPFIYGRDYFLGDTVMLRYKDRTRRSLVNEYTRIDDAEGTREYPGFIAWDDIRAGVLNDW